MSLHISLPSRLLLLIFPMLVSPPLPLQHHFALSHFYSHRTNCHSLISSLFVFLLLLFSIFISFALECSSPDFSLGLLGFNFFFMISPFHTCLPILLSFLFSEANKEFFMFLLVSLRWGRDSSRFSQLVRPRKPKQRDVFHLPSSVAALQVKFIAEGVGWVARKVEEVWHMEDFSVSGWGSTAAWMLWLSRFACHVIYLRALLWSGGGLTEHFLCSE